MKRYITGILALSLMAVPWDQSVDAAAAVQVIIDDDKVSFDQEPMILHDFTMVPMREIFEKLGAEVNWNQATQTVVATKDEVTIQLKIGSTFLLKNYQQIPVDVPAYVQNGRTFVPLRVISESFGADVAWDQAAKTVHITSPQKKIKLDTTTATLTLEDAVKSAEAHSYDMKTAHQNIESNDIRMEEASDNLEYTPIGTGNGQDDAAARSAFKQVASSNINYSVSKKQAEVTSDQVRFSVMKAYHDLFIKQNDVIGNEESLETAQMEEQAALAKAKVGRISEVDKNQIIKARKEAEKNLQTARTALSDAWMKLNTLMGKPKDSTYLLVDKPTYTEPEEWDVSTQITRMISSSPSIWLLEKQVELAELDVDLFTFNAGGNYELTEMDVEKAQTALASGKEQLEETIRNMYSDMERLKDQYHLLEINLQTAEDNLRVTEAKYAKGLVTALDVKKEKNNVNQKKRQLEEIAIQMDQLNYRWNKPWTN
ncbi:stalk domain-containing protein [Ammoniphilus sp. 3BR4]|uniref:stalk domain-containing protein n=1 Tax=Ammoniphilus sp. 3BR4 TaxID=3158265 RepID=UPI0034671B3A